jgi:hypothetical protein
MTDYSDIPQVNALYQEQQQVQQAINLIDAGGTLATFAVRPPPYDPENPSPMMMMAVSITLNEPAAPDTMVSIRAQLVIRNNEIDDELVALGIENPPAKRE